MPTIQDVAQWQATLSDEAFAARLSGRALLIRLDERGGDKDPAAWAFRGTPTTLRFEPRDDTNVDLSTIRNTLASVSDTDTREFRRSDVFNTNFSEDDGEETKTLAGTALPLPAARGAASIYFITAGEPVLKVGRADRADLILDEQSVSRKHAEIHVEGKTHFVIDTGSQNGTRVSGQDIARGERRPLGSGDTVSFGDVRCLFLDLDTFLSNLAGFSD